MPCAHGLQAQEVSHKYQPALWRVFGALRASLKRASKLQVKQTPSPLATIPPAPRPAWLPTSGQGQRHVDAVYWTISVGNWLRVLEQCMCSRSWRALCHAKGRDNINMHDINTHFIIPWTQETGSSIAMLLNGDSEPQPAEIMLSHAWCGSALETYSAMLSLLTLHMLPRTTRVFFCTFCLYQCEDGKLAC